MNIVLLGYGKMGKAIEEIALQRGHTIVLKVDQHNQGDFIAGKLTGADIAIEFTGPHSAAENIYKCLGYSIPVVCGSTGWLHQWDEVSAHCKKTNGAILYASNFSIGVNLFFELNQYLVTLMAGHKEYNVQMEEIHHTQKKDAPSGTAITLAGQILAGSTSKKNWVNRPEENAGELSIISKRIDPAPGTHCVKYSSPIDDIEIIHTAHNRTGFATGAVLAAEFLAGKTGVYSMKDVLGL